MFKKITYTFAFILTSISFSSCDGGSSGSDNSASSNNTNLTEEIEVFDPGENEPPIQNPVTNVLDSNPGGSNTTPDNSDEILNDLESELYELIITSPRQQRSNFRIDPILSQVAREHAEDMANRNFFSHTNPDGDGPNTRARNAGYSLPSFYSTAQTGNNIESIAAGGQTPQDTLQQWINSPSHKLHVFAEVRFFETQTNIGVGVAEDPNTPNFYYWVFLSANP